MFRGANKVTLDAKGRMVMTEELLPPQALQLMKPNAITPAVEYMFRMIEDARIHTLQPPSMEKRSPVNEIAQCREGEVV